MIEKYCEHFPQIHPTAFVHASGQIIGQVTMARDSSVWPFAVLRGDIEPIVIGEESNVQDNAVLHTVQKFPTIIGNQVTIGHAAILHGCTVRDRCIIGMGSIILDGALVEEDCIIGAGSVVPPGAVIAKGHLALGVPARAIRTLRPDELERIRWNAAEYLKLKSNYKLAPPLTIVPPL